MESPVRIYLSATLIVHLVLLSSSNVQSSAVPPATTQEPKAATPDVSPNVKNSTWGKNNKRPEAYVKEVLKNNQQNRYNIDQNESNSKESGVVTTVTPRGRVKYLKRESPKVTTLTPRRRTTMKAEVLIVTPEPTMKKLPEIINNMKKYKLSVSTTPTLKPYSHNSKVFEEENSGEKEHDSFFNFRNNRDRDDNYEKHFTYDFDNSGFYPSSFVDANRKMPNHKRHQSPYESDFDDIILTTPKNDFFDNKFSEIYQSIAENIDRNKNDIFKAETSHSKKINDLSLTKSLNVNDFMSKNPSNNSQLYIHKSKSILVSDNEADGSSLSDVQGTSIYYEQSMLSTESYGSNTGSDDDCDDDSTTKKTPSASPIEKVVFAPLSTKEPTPPQTIRNSNDYKTKKNAQKLRTTTQKNKLPARDFTIPQLGEIRNSLINKNSISRSRRPTIKPAVKDSIAEESDGALNFLSSPVKFSENNKQLSSSNLHFTGTNNKKDHFNNTSEHSKKLINYSTTTETVTTETQAPNTEKPPRTIYNWKTSLKARRPQLLNSTNKVSTATVFDPITVDYKETESSVINPTVETTKSDDVDLLQFDNSAAKAIRKIQFTTPKTRVTYRISARRNNSDFNVRQKQPAKHLNTQTALSQKQNLLTTVSSEIDPVNEPEISGAKKIVHTHPISDNSIPSVRKRGSAKYAGVSTSIPAALDNYNSEVFGSTGDLTLPTASSSWGALVGMRNTPISTNVTAVNKNLDENELQKFLDPLTSDKLLGALSTTTAALNSVEINTKSPISQGWKPLYSYNNTTDTNLSLAKLKTKPLLTNELTDDSKVGASTNNLQSANTETGWIPVNSTEIKKDLAPEINTTAATFSVSSSHTQFESISKIPFSVDTTSTSKTPVKNHIETTNANIPTTEDISDFSTAIFEEISTEKKIPNQNSAKSLLKITTTPKVETDATLEPTKWHRVTDSNIAKEFSTKSKSLTSTAQTSPILSPSVTIVTEKSLLYATTTIKLNVSHISTKTSSTDAPTEYASDKSAMASVTATMTTKLVTPANVTRPSFTITEPPLPVIKSSPTVAVELNSSKITDDAPVTTYRPVYFGNSEMTTEIQGQPTITLTSAIKSTINNSEAVSSSEITKIVETMTITAESSTGAEETTVPIFTDEKSAELSTLPADDATTVQETEIEPVTTINSATTFETSTDITNLEELKSKTEEMTTEQMLETTTIEALSTKNLEVLNVTNKQNESVQTSTEKFNESTTEEEPTTEESTTVRNESRLEDLTSNFGEDLTTHSPKTGNVTEVSESSAAGVAIAVSTIGVVALLLLIGLMLVLRRRRIRGRRCEPYAQRCTPVSLDTYSLDSVNVRRKGTRLRASKRSYGNPAYDDEVVISHPMQYAALANFAMNSESIAAEFSEIPSVSVRADEVPPGCEDKNRFSNILPLPETRVPLTKVEGDPTSEYINANYVTGPGSIKNYYIACQAPMANTVDDFWRMMWEQNSRVIVMLTEYMENGAERCYEYLPPSEVTDNKRTFGDFQIILKHREQCDKYAISSIQLKNLNTKTWREITHLWYFWPAKGVPEDYDSVINFLSEIRSHMKISQSAKEFDEDDAAISENANEPQDERTSPGSARGVHVYSPQRAEEMMRKGVSNGNNGTLCRMKAAAEAEGVRPCTVMCASGAGRTGALMALDVCARALEACGSVDVPRAVRALRSARPHAVQNKQQYIFLYKVLSEYGHKLNGGGVDSI